MACEEDKIPVAPLATITAVGVHVCLVVAFGVAAMLGMAERKAEAERAAGLVSPYRAQIAEQRAAVEEGQSGGLSVERAMDRIVLNQQGE